MSESKDPATNTDTNTPVSPPRFRRRFLLRALAATGLAITLTAGVGAGTASAAVIDKGIVTDSLYLSRSETKAFAHRLDRVSSRSDIAAGFAAGLACAATGIGGTAAVVCGFVGGFGTATLKDVSRNAAADDECLRFRYLHRKHADPRPPIFLGISQSDGKHCRD